jgi:effector-binding domain-containing protein
MNRFIPLIAVVGLIVIAGFALTGQTEETKTVKVDLPALKAMEYFSDTSKLSRWLVPFSSSDASFSNDQLITGDDTLRILNRSAFNMELKRSDPSGSFTYRISVAPHKDSVNQSFFNLSYTIPRWSSLRGNKFADEAEASLDSLTSFLGNPAKLYGYEIIGERVEDTSFLFASKKIDRKDFAAETKALYDMLIEEAKKRDAGYNGVRIFHFIDSDSSTRTIFASIGVTKRVETKEGEKVSYKMMPYQHNLLVVYYEGPYRKIPEVYNAMEQFKIDNRHVSMAIPFHKYLDEGYGFTEDQNVRVKVCYPVF